VWNHVLGACACVILQARLGLPTGHADIGLQPCNDNLLFLQTLRKDFEKVRTLLQLVVNRERLKREEVCLLSLMQHRTDMWPVE